MRFENVCFSYEEGRPVINQVDFQVPRGKTLALIGATGSGKTTIVNLLTRFYDADSGRISVDGRDNALADCASAITYRRLL